MSDGLSDLVRALEVIRERFDLIGIVAEHEEWTISGRHDEWWIDTPHGSTQIKVN